MNGEIASIPAIPVIDALLPIAAVPRIVASATNNGSAGFRPNELPPAVLQAFASGAGFWRDAMREAKKAEMDPARIADVIFFMQHPERMAGGAGTLIAEGEPEFYKLRAEWDLYLTIATRFLKRSFTPDVFLPERAGRKYEDFVAARTTGKVTLMFHGRKSDGKGRVDPATHKLIGGSRDVVETFVRMEETVESLRAGDSLYIVSWQFYPGSLPLNADPSKTWGDLLVRKANDGVRIRIIIAQHPVFSIWMTNLTPLNDMIASLPADKTDQLKYIVSRHPHVAGVHHQKFVVAKAKKSTVAFCGGLDLSFRSPQNWTINWVWHDVAAKLEGRIASDFERQFVELWNRDRAASAVPPLDGWSPFEKLTQRGATAFDKKGAVNQHPVQMLRTVSLGIEPSDIRRDDIWRGYFRLIGRASRFIYLENQYFQQPNLADAIVKQVQSQPGMIVIVVVGTGTDDPDNFISDNMYALRLAFFQRLSTLSPSQLRVYTLNYKDGITHSKLILVDDEALSVGSANANPRGFFLDTEVNFVLDHTETVRSFRHRLWAHNLGVEPEDVAKWKIGEFFTRWDKVASSNKDLQNAPERMVGEGVIPFSPTDPSDPRFRKGDRGRLAEVLF